MSVIYYKRRLIIIFKTSLLVDIIYFFYSLLGTKFWKFDPLKKPPVKSSYPKSISNWKGIPDNINAVLHYTNDYTYFFKNENYYRFNDKTFAVSAVLLVIIVF